MSVMDATTSSLATGSTIDSTGARCNIGPPRLGGPPVLGAAGYYFNTMNAPARIAVVTTGGTIDKLYFDSLSEYQVGDSVVRKLLSIANVKYSFDIIEALRKDSLELTDADRDLLFHRIASLETTQVVVTHGTDTMTTTAARLEGIPGKTIVMTGALAPARFSESDASFNLGMAFATAQVAPPGVFIVMNGEVFPAAQVRKDRTAGRFVRSLPG
jgi:L-asparaginase